MTCPQSLVDLEPPRSCSHLGQSEKERLFPKFPPLVPRVRKTAAPRGARGRAVTPSGNVWQGWVVPTSPWEAREARNLEWRGRSWQVRHYRMHSCLSVAFRASCMLAAESLLLMFLYLQRSRFQKVVLKSRLKKA